MYNFTIKTPDCTVYTPQGLHLDHNLQSCDYLQSGGTGTGVGGVGASMSRSAPSSWLSRGKLPPSGVAGKLPPSGVAGSLSLSLSLSLSEGVSTFLFLLVIYNLTIKTLDCTPRRVCTYMETPLRVCVARESWTIQQPLTGDLPRRSNLGP